jgi:hypothetical protein
VSLRDRSQGITQGKVALQIRTAQIRCPRNFVVSLAQLTRGVDMLLAAEPLLSLAVTVTSEQRVESVLEDCLGIGIATRLGVGSHLAAPLCRSLWFRPGTLTFSRADRVSSSRGKRRNSCELTGGRLVLLAGTL